MRRSLSLRARIVLLVLAVALVPLGLVGWWLTRTAARSGEDLLRLRLAESLEQVVADIGPRWIAYRSSVLSLSESDAVQQALTDAHPRPAEAPAAVQRAFEALDPAIRSIIIRDDAGGSVWTLDRREALPPGDEALGSALLATRLDVFARLSERRLGEMEVRLRVSDLLTTRRTAALVNGAVLAILDASGASLISTPFDPANLVSPQFHWAGESWLTERRSLAEPRLELVAAAPMEPFTAPFEDAARQGLLVLLAAGAAALCVAVAITARMTRRLRRLAEAADAVARGDLARKTEAAGGDEVARVAHAFNAMTDSLERTLGALSQREALAAVGSFASELAHEVRNPLTAIRVDLQVVEEQLPAGSPAREIQRGALEEIDRLDGTVSGVLQLARSGKIQLEPVDLTEILGSVVRSVRPEFEGRGAIVAASLTSQPVMVMGDARALRQLALNLLLNAAQALGNGGCAGVELQVDSRDVVVVVKDDGPGMASDVLARVREPFYSTKASGTGLGLAIADRIARAHGAPLDIESEPGVGTVVRVRLAPA